MDPPIKKSDVAYLYAPSDLPTCHPDYECPPILIKNVDGLPDIDIVDAFRQKLFSSRCKHDHDKRGVVLPPSVYNPSWEHMDSVRMSIIQAAKKAKLNMYCKTTVQDLQSKNKTAGEGKHFILACKFNGNSKARDDAAAEFVKKTPVKSAFGVPTYQSDTAYKKDAIIGKASSTRPGGRALPRRMQSQKRNGGTPATGGHRCPFTIRVNLVEGTHWYVPWKDYHSIFHHGHITADVGELDGKANQLDPEIRKEIADMAEHLANGCGLQNMSKHKTGEFVIGGFVVGPRTKVVSMFFSWMPSHCQCAAHSNAGFAP